MRPFRATGRKLLTSVSHKSEFRIDRIEVYRTYKLSGRDMKKLLVAPKTFSELALSLSRGTIIAGAQESSRAT